MLAVYKTGWVMPIDSLVLIQWLSKQENNPKVIILVLFYRP